VKAATYTELVRAGYTFLGRRCRRCGEEIAFFLTPNAKGAVRAPRISLTLRDVPGAAGRKKRGRRKSSMRANEADLAEAVRLLDLPAEVVCRLAEAGKLKSRQADGTVYFLILHVQDLARCQAEEARAAEPS
jgi:hypothetical protein